MESRRKFLKKAMYVTPLVLSTAVRPAHACHGYRQAPQGGGGSVPIKK